MGKLGITLSVIRIQMGWKTPLILRPTLSAETDAKPVRRGRVITRGKFPFREVGIESKITHESHAPGIEAEKSYPAITISRS